MIVHGTIGTLIWAFDGHTLWLAIIDWHGRVSGRGKWR